MQFNYSVTLCGLMLISIGVSAQQQATVDSDTLQLTLPTVQVDGNQYFAEFNYLQGNQFKLDSNTLAELGSSSTAVATFDPQSLLLTIPEIRYGTASLTADFRHKQDGLFELLQVSDLNKFTLSSPASKDDILPLSATCDGADRGQSPALTWGQAPAGTAAFAITMHNFPNANDLASGDLSLAHYDWLLYNIPADVSMLESGASAGGSFGPNSVNGEFAYTGPCSRDPIDNNYIITLYALSQTLDLAPADADLVTLSNAARAVALESTSLVFGRVRYNPNEDKHVPTTVPIDCASKQSAFLAYNDRVTISCDETTLTVTSYTGLPARSQLAADKPKVGISSWIGRVPLPLTTTWTLPLQPSYLSSVSSNLLIHYPIGITTDGVPILHYAKESSQNEIAQLGMDYSDRDTAKLGEIDQCGGHAGNGEDYHYHYAPLCMMDTHDPAQPLAYMFDGIPLYFGTAGGQVSSGGVDFGGGRYTDLNYLPQAVKTGSRSLDECNAYDLNGDGTAYVYYTTQDAPYTIGCFRGQADQVSSAFTGPHWQTERDLSWSGAEVQITDYEQLTFDGKTWYAMSMTPGESNNRIASGNTAVILYRKLEATDAGFVQGGDCWMFRYRLNSADTDGANDIVESQCR